MKKINEGLEPKEWTEYRLTPGVDYQAIPELRESLLKEQGYICAYCMRRIPVKDSNSNETSRIDHILSRTNHDNLKLNYQNMVICCPGAINNDKFHCDKSKGEEDLIFNFDEVFISTISYGSKDGLIKSSNTTANTQMLNLLNLNHPLLKKNRRKALEGVVQSLTNLSKKNGNWKKSEIQEHIKNWDSKDHNNMFKPYCGIVIWYLSKKIG